MTEEHADSGSIDMDAAMESISNDLFPAKEEPQEEFDVVEEVVEEVVEAAPEETPEESEEKTEEKTEEGRPPPQSWKKEMHDVWNSLSEDAKSYVEQRESQMRDGLEKDRGDATLGRTMRDVMAPYSEIIKSQGIDETQLVRNLMNAHVRLATSDPAQKKELFNHLAQSYGVSLDGEPPQEVDPVMKAMQDKVNNLEQYLTQTQRDAQQAERERVNREVEEFASDPNHPFFDEVSEQIVPLINAGYTLEDAYENAIWLNPVTRQKEMDRTAKEAADKAQEEAKKEAEKAKKAKAANVRGRDTNRASTEPTGTMEDTMREVYREIQSRSH